MNSWRNQQVFYAESWKKEQPKNSCASSKVATAGGAIGGRAGTGGHFQFGSDVVF